MPDKQKNTQPSKRNNKLSQQSIRQFKLEIDHQIAKCLDTLDRKGLKFLKQTLKTSNLFNSSILQQIQQQAQQYERQQFRKKISQVQNERKQITSLKKQQEAKKYQSTTNNAKPARINKTDSIKKVDRPIEAKRQSKKQIGQAKMKNKQKDQQQTKKQHTTKTMTPSKSNSSVAINSRVMNNSRVPGKAIVIQNEQTKEKITIGKEVKKQKDSLGQKLNKKMAQLSISRVGPDSKNIKKNMKKAVEKNVQIPKLPEQIIDEQIMEGIQEQIQEQQLQKPKNLEAYSQNNFVSPKSSLGSLVQLERAIKLKDQKLNPFKQIKKQPNPQDSKTRAQGTTLQSLSEKNESKKYQAQQRIYQDGEIQENLQIGDQVPDNTIKPQLIANHKNFDKNEQKQTKDQRRRQNEGERVSQSIQVGSDIYGFKFAEEQNISGLQISQLVQKINQLSPSKFVKIQKYIDYMQNNVSSQFDQISRTQSAAQTFEEVKNQDKQSKNNFSEYEQDKSLNGKDMTQENSANIHKNFTCKSGSSPSKSPHNQKIMKTPFSKNIRQSRQSGLIINNNSSKKTNRQKKQKASSIFNGQKSASRSRIKIISDLEDEKPQDIMQRQVSQAEEKVDQIEKQAQIDKQKSSHLSKQAYLNSYSNMMASKHMPTKQKITLPQQIPLKMERIDFDLPLSKQTTSKPQNCKAVQSNQIHQNTRIIQQTRIVQNRDSLIDGTDVKMINLKTKLSLERPQVIESRTKIKFKILSNRGHPSLFGLTSIQLYTIDRKKVMVAEKQLENNKNSSAKILKLFNGSHFTVDESNMYLSTLEKNQISLLLERENQKIGGVRIYNFNKSSLESNKQVDQLQIYHNDSKMWKGTINKGSYNQTANYATEIEFMPNFKFPSQQKSNYTSQNLSNLVQPNKNKKLLSTESPDWIQKTEWNSNPHWMQIQEGAKKIMQLEIQSIQHDKHSLSFSRNRRSQISLGQKYQNDKDKIFNRILQDKAIKSKNANNNILNQDIFQSDRSKAVETQIQTERCKNTPISSKIKETEKIDKLHSINQKRLQQNKMQRAQISASRNNQYDQFDSLLKGLQQQNINRQKSKSRLTSMAPKVKSLQNNNSNLNQKKQAQKPKIKDVLQKIQAKNETDDIMNDSYFNEKPKIQRNISAKLKFSPKKTLLQEEKNPFIEHKPQERLPQMFKKGQNTTISLTDKINIDDFLGELQNVMANKNQQKIANFSEKSFAIPNLPSGQTVQLQILQNWGHQAYVGLQGIQFFDQEGNQIHPLSIICNKNYQNTNLNDSLNCRNIANRSQKVQTKLSFSKTERTVLTFRFSQKKALSLIRIWNYNGQRVHSNIGIKYCMIKMDDIRIFMGQIDKNESSAENFHKHFEAILFTKDTSILKSIKKNDWLSHVRNTQKKQKQLFKSTLLNFNRPKTRNNDLKQSQNVNKSNFIQQKQIKISKRSAWQYQPPEMPSGKVLVFLLHDTWGDTNFIGLNGIQIFDHAGIIVQKQNIAKIKAFPSTTGQTNDKRVVQNLVNGHNASSMDQNIWMTTFQSDIQKLESGNSNTILIELTKSVKISGINVFNYSKTPNRGAHQIEIQIDAMLAFRGYIKMFNQKSPPNCLHTTINFTKDEQILRKMNYETYNEDNTDQNVQFCNQKKKMKT